LVKIFLVVISVIAASEAVTALVVGYAFDFRLGTAQMLLLDAGLGTLLAGPCLFYWGTKELRARRQAEEEARQHAGMQSILYEIARLCLRDMPLEELLCRILDRLFQAPSLRPDSRGGVFILDPETDALVLRAARGECPDVDLCARVPLGDGCCGRAALTGRVEFAGGENQEHRLRHPHAPAHGLYCVPIRLADKCLGVLQVHVQPGHRRDEREAVFLEAVGGLIAVVISRQAAQEELRRLGTAIEQSSEIVVITDSNGAIQYVNPAFCRVTGFAREEALGRNPRLLKSGKQDQAFYAWMWRTVSGGKVWSGRLTNKKKDGSLYEEQMTISPVKDASGQIVNYVAVMRDVTAEANLENQLRQSQKLEAVGLLAGGLAHDFNNVLTSIVGYNYFMLEGLEPGNPLRAFSLEIRRSAQVAAALTRQLLAISRKQIVEPRLMDVNTVLMETTKMFRRLLGENIKLSLETQPSLWPVKIDSGQLEQVILNLVVNARDAMPQGGNLAIATKNLTVGVRGQPDPMIVLPPGQYVCLEVEDTGVGMSAEVRERLFEPFFTTKEAGRGTGLGLATIHGIVKQYGGQIAIQSEPGRGSRFRIYLRRAEGGAEAMLPGEAPRASRGGHETILVVEDNAVLRGLIKKALRDKGYRVFSAGNGHEALSACRIRKENIQLLLTDLVLPDINGTELAVQVAALKPRIKVAYMSGYAGSLQALNGIDRDTVLIEKPFSPETLLSALRRALDAGRVEAC